MMATTAHPDGAGGPTQEGEVGADHFALKAIDGGIDFKVRIRFQGQAAEVQMGADLDVSLPVGDRSLQV